MEKQQKINAFIDTVFNSVKKCVNTEGFVIPHVSILLEDENGEYFVEQQRLPDMPIDDNFQSITKALLIGAIVKAYFATLSERFKIIHIIHSETITFPDGSEMLFFYQKDENNKSVSNFYDIKRKENLKVKEDGELVLSEADFIERNIKGNV